MVEDDEELTAYIHFFRRKDPLNKDNIFQLCKFLTKEGLKFKYGNVKTHLHKIQQDLKQTSVEVDNSYDDDYHEGGFENQLFGIRCQLALYGPFDNSLN